LENLGCSGQAVRILPGSGYSKSPDLAVILPDKLREHTFEWAHGLSLFLSSLALQNNRNLHPPVSGEVSVREIRQIQQPSWYGVPPVAERRFAGPISIFVSDFVAQFSHF
jgi:hypothetical protein